jgi:hypothetical protein
MVFNGVKQQGRLDDLVAYLKQATQQDRQGLADLAKAWMTASTSRVAAGAFCGQSCLTFRM